ncbi:MAG: hypothetical protein GF317_04100 [Candidatus Lokiarchaeota archaeon]|nr:hypothetical protein [Candidatus Lokiarchaeota archaeon]MBD3199069.1 hypothetical protein [Candidatus Lokiarchaeota archaeon]
MSYYKSGKIKFKILEILKDNPTHGYNLMSILSEKQINSQPSYLYKILRSMKENGLVIGEETPSDQGPNKEILYLTDKGEKEYYNLLIDSASAFFQLIMEANIKAISKFNIKMLNQVGFGPNELEGKVIYFYGPNIPYNLLGQIIRGIFGPLDIKIRIYIQAPKNLPENAFKSFDNTKVELILFDSRLGLRANTIDIMFILGDSLIKPLKDVIQESIDILKNDSVVFFHVRSQEKAKRPRMFFKIIQEVLKEFPVDKDKLAKIFPRTFIRKFPGKRLKKEEINSILNEHFNKVKVIEDQLFMDIFMGKNPRKS